MNPDSKNFGRIVAIEIVNQIPYNRFPRMKVISETGFGAVIRPIMSTVKTQLDPVTEEIIENGAIRTDTSIKDIRGRRVDQVFKVVQCVGTYPSMKVTPLTSYKPIIQDVEKPTEPTEPTITETNVPDTTTTSQIDTSTDTSTPTTPPPTQQTTGQSDTPAPPSPPSGGGSEGSGGGYGGY